MGKIVIPNGSKLLRKQPKPILVIKYTPKADKEAVREIMAQIELDKELNNDYHIIFHGGLVIDKVFVLNSEEVEKMPIEPRKTFKQRIKGLF